MSPSPYLDPLSSKPSSLEINLEPLSTSLGDGVDALSRAPNDLAGRRDGRTANEMRQYTVTMGALSEADASARYQSAGTDVLVAIYGPMDCPIHKQNPSTVHIEVSYRQRGGVYASQAGEKGSDFGQGAEVSAARDLRLVVMDIIERTVHPRKAIVVAVQVLSDNGSVKAAVYNATFLALTDAGMLMSGAISAVSVAIRNTSLIVDPVKVEELESDAVITVVFDIACANNGFLSLHTKGEFRGKAVLTAAVEMARSIAAKHRVTMGHIVEQYGRRKLISRVVHNLQEKTS